jgi:Leucine-rich repeat (LRR) protein
MSTTIELLKASAIAAIQSDMEDAVAADAAAAAASASAAADASRLTAGTTTTGAPGTSAAVAITGAAGAQVLDVTIPRGEQGATGPQGQQGIQGATGPQGIQGATGPQGVQGEVGPPGTTDYTLLTNVPATFPPSAHTHPVSDIVSIASERLLGRHAVGSGAGQEVTVGNGIEFSGSGIRRSELTGDVTASAGSNATTIANDAVTNAKLANVPTATIKGRTTAGTGDPEDLTAAQALDLIGAETPAGVAAQIAAALTPSQIMSKVGEQLIASLQIAWQATAGTAHFATTKVTSGTLFVSTSTGYARLINADGSLGVQAGTGVAGDSITLTIPASGLHRALGVLSVVNGGSVRSGNITFLGIASNQLTSFSGTGLSSLTSLGLASNQLTSFSGTGLSSLTSLYLASNQLTSFSGTGLSSLTSLGLNNNQLTSFSGTGLSSLTNLELNLNQLTSFSGTGLSSLTTLYLYGNQLTSFSGTGLSSLTILYLNLNQLTSFSGTELSSLVELGLYDNQLTSFSGTGLSSLAYLSLSNNQLTSFSGTGLSSLVELSLDSNQLTSFSGTGLSSLVELYLDSNQLTSFSGTGLSSLTILELNSNQLTSIDGAGMELSYGYYGYRGSDFRNNALSAAAINAFFTSLGSASGVLDVRLNPGSATCDPTIATAKGYTVVTA